MVAENPIEANVTTPAEIDDQKADLEDEPTGSTELPVSHSPQPNPFNLPISPAVDIEDNAGEVKEVRDSAPQVVRESALPSPPPSSVSYFGSPILTGSHPVHETIDEEVPSDLMAAVNEMAPQDSLTAGGICATHRLFFLDSRMFFEHVN